MDILQFGQEYKTIGNGEAIVLEVTTVAGQNNHYIKIRHPDFGNTNFIPYLQTSGLYRIPRVGDNVYCFAKEGFTEYPIAWGHQLTPAQITALIGNRKDDIMVMYSAGPQNNSIWHKITLDDIDGEGIKLLTHGGNRVELKDSGDIDISHVSGSKITVADAAIDVVHTSGSKVTITDSQVLMEIQGTKVVLTSTGIELISAQGAKLTLTDGIKIESSQGTTAEFGATANITSADSQGTVDGVIIKTHTHITTAPGQKTTPPVP